MAREKVKLQWIADRANRQAAYKRRSRSLMKKAGELVTLTGAKAAVVVYGEADNSGVPAPEVWPSAEEAAPLLTKFKEMPDGSSLKKTTSQGQHIQERISKVREEAKKLNAENSEFATSKLLHESMAGLRPGLEGTTAMELVQLNAMVEKKMGKVLALLQARGLVGQGAGAQPLLSAKGGELDAVVGGASAAGAAVAMNDGGELGAVVGAAALGFPGARE